MQIQSYEILALAQVLFIIQIHSFEFGGYCQQMCMIGRGGNLCKCSAVHFAGKRDSSSRESDDIDIFDTQDTQDLIPETSFFKNEFDPWTLQKLIKNHSTKKSSTTNRKNSPYIDINKLAELLNKVSTRSR